MQSDQKLTRQKLETGERLKAGVGLVFRSGKTYTHSQGLSCAFRQWRALDSHCHFIHGYSLQVELEFLAANGLDERNWVVNFGGLKQVKQMLEDVFDHKTLVAVDDPQVTLFKEMELAGLIQLQVVEHVGCEAFAKLIYDNVDRILFGSPIARNNPTLTKVTVREHEGNWASYGQ